MVASACIPDPVRKVPAAHMVQLKVTEAPAYPFSKYHTRPLREELVMWKGDRPNPVP
jgi:hypothetical protein